MICDQSSIGESCNKNWTQLIGNLLYPSWVNTDIPEMKDAFFFKFWRYSNIKNAMEKVCFLWFCSCFVEVRQVVRKLFARHWFEATLFKFKIEFTRFPLIWNLVVERIVQCLFDSMHGFYAILPSQIRRKRRQEFRSVLRGMDILQLSPLGFRVALPPRRPLLWF